MSAPSPDVTMSPLPPGLLAARIGAAVALVALVFWAGVYDEIIFAFLTTAWQKILGALGFSEQLASLQQSVSGEVTKRSLPAVITYALLYTSACLLLLRLVLPAGRMRLVLVLYGAVFGCCVLLLVGGKLAGNSPWVYQLGRRLIDFIVSPLPVIGLVVLLRWYAPASGGKAVD